MQRQRDPKAVVIIKTYQSPADPTLPDALALSVNWLAQVSSYAVNAYAFEYSPRFPSTFPDGTSSTMLVAEHYAFNCNGALFWIFDSDLPSGGMRRASFAD